MCNTFFYIHTTFTCSACITKDEARAVLENHLLAFFFIAFGFIFENVSNAHINQLVYKYQA